MLRKIPFYPVLFAGFCVLTLMAYNIHEIALSDMWASLIFALLISVIVYGLTRLLIHDWHRAALVSFAALFSFFTYGQIYNLLKNVSIGNVYLFRHRTLLILYGLLLIVAVYWILRRLASPERWTYWLNLLSIYLLIYPAFVISSNAIQQFLAYRSALSARAVQAQTTNSARPDIYYIILDAYGRGDVLKNDLGFDNSAFLDALQERGFYVADCSQSNYPVTEYSLASSLNYDYLEHEYLNVDNEPERIALIKHSAFRSFLEGQGYRIVSAPTGWGMTEWKDANIYLDFDRSYSALPEFEKLTMDTTLLRIVSDFNLFNINRITDNNHRSRVLSLLNHLKRLPSEEGDLFVFAHFVIPHPPYRFGPNGEWLEGRPDDFPTAYINQVIFINHEILQVIDTILAKSETPPVIIIQGDHGPPPEISSSSAQKMPILNAYYLPGVDTEKVLYSSISPVNSLRVVLNSYFGQNLPLLEDISYYAPDKHLDALELAPYTCPNQP
jgi:hypothetical protein